MGNNVVNAIGFYLFSVPFCLVFVPSDCFQSPAVFCFDAAAEERRLVYFQEFDQP